MNVYTYECMSQCMSACMSVCLDMRVRVRVRVCTYVCMHECLSVRVHFIYMFAQSPTRKDTCLSCGASAILISRTWDSIRFG